MEDTKGGKQGTRTNKEEQSGKSTLNGPLVRRMQDKEVQRRASTINGEVGRSRHAGKDKRSSIEDIEVQEKQTGPIPKEPD